MSRVLVIDDDVTGLEMRRLVLERSGHQVQAASTADQAREAFAAFASDCVILDMRLPDAATGLALIREFRGAAPGARIVILTGRQSELEGREERRLVDAVLAKPVRSDVLLRAVAGVGSARGAEQPG